MKYTYDKVADAFYFYFNHKEVRDSFELTNQIIVDLEERDEIVGFEILDFSRLCITPS